MTIVKRCLVSLLMVGALPEYVLPCDVCGCGIGGPYAGLTPFADKAIISLRYSSTSFDSHLTYSELFRTSEQFYRAEANARLIVVDRLLLSGTIPFAYNHQRIHAQERSLTTSGIGDVVATVSWLFSSSEIVPTEDPGWRSSLLLSAGISAPTGQWRYDSSATDVANANFQTGSGSWDPIVSMLATYRNDDVGVQGLVLGRLPTRNPNGYKFGTSLVVNIGAFYVASLDSWAMVPRCDMSFERSSMNDANGRAIAETGGYAFALAPAMDVRWKDILTTFSIWVPVYQTYGGGALRSGPRYSMSMGILIP
ncbi:MAG: hypothetical protein MUC47_00750 [Candidatus Kapabacteria bacterium]|nr:hypothetical protein [Candidatus Kapabacteria bacterium]